MDTEHTDAQLNLEGVMYRVINVAIEDSFSLEEELNRLARLGFRAVATMSGSELTAPLIILELQETFSLTEQGDQAVSQILSS